METGEKIRSVRGSFERRDHWHVTRLSLQLDGSVSSDERRRRKSPALHSHCGIRHQTAAADTDERLRVSLCQGCRDNGWPCDHRGNTDCWRKSLRHMPGSLRRGEGRPSRVSSMVAALLLLLAASTPGSTSDFANRILSIEQRTGARIGVAALDTGSGKRLEYRSEERFPMRSTFKFLAAEAS